jgi:hypothetical protein
MQLPWRLLFPVVLAGSVACGYDGTQPDESESLYVLHRIGNRELPAPGFPWPESPLIVADSIRLSVSLANYPKVITIKRSQAYQEHSGQVLYFAGRYNASLSWNLLTIDNCPIESACFASLVYSATTMLVAGDSLFEVVGDGNPVGPRVYGRVRR